MDRLKCLAVDILNENCGDVDEDTYKVLAQYVGYPFLINCKMERDYGLCDLDIDYLVTLMNKQVSLTA